MRSLKNLGVTILFTGALLALGFTSLQPLFRAARVDALDSSKAPTWALKDTDGKLVKSSDFEGKVVLLDFWATWCAPCKAEIPGFIELQQRYSSKGLVVVGVSLDERGPSVVRKFMEDLRMNYPVVMGNFKLMEEFGGTAIPTTFVIDRSGKIVAKHVGFATKEAFERDIAPLL